MIFHGSLFLSHKILFFSPPDYSGVRLFRNVARGLTPGHVRIVITFPPFFSCIACIPPLPSPAKETFLFPDVTFSSWLLVFFLSVGPVLLCVDRTLFPSDALVAELAGSAPFFP